MSGVYIERDDAKEKYGIDSDAIEAATGRKVSAIWRESSWADEVDDSMKPHIYGVADAPRIVTGFSIYLETPTIEDEEKQA